MQQIREQQEYMKKLARQGRSHAADGPGATEGESKDLPSGFYGYDEEENELPKPHPRRNYPAANTQAFLTMLVGCKFLLGIALTGWSCVTYSAWTCRTVVQWFIERELIDAIFRATIFIAMEGKILAAGTPIGLRAISERGLSSRASGLCTPT